MNVKLSRLFLLLAGTVPTLLISGHAGAVSSPNPSFNEVKSSVNFASNTAEKLNLLAPQSESFIAKKRDFRRVIQPDGFRDVFREVSQPQTGTLQIQSFIPSAVDTFNSLSSQDSLG